MTDWRYLFPARGALTSRRPAGHRTPPFLAYARSAALVVVLSGCSSTPPQKTAPAAPTIPAPIVAPVTWNAIDHAIWTASIAFEGLADAYGRSAAEEWLGKVRQRTKDYFIPWYSGYWTQKWLSVKVAWYEMSQSEGDPEAAQRLAAYLQEQFEARVLEPIAREIDPVRITDQATSIYLGGLRDTIEEIPTRYPVAPAALDARLAVIPAIAVPPPDSQGASLYQALHARAISDLPAYRVLTGRGAAQYGENDPLASKAGMRTAAGRVVAGLPLQLALQGGGAVATFLGGAPGMLISVGLSGIDAAQHAVDQPEMEVQLRKALAKALEEVRHDLLADSVGGVLAPVRHMSTQIEASLSRPYRQYQPGQASNAFREPRDAIRHGGL